MYDCSSNLYEPLLVLIDSAAEDGASQHTITLRCPMMDWSTGGEVNWSLQQGAPEMNSL